MATKIAGASADVNGCSVEIRGENVGTFKGTYKLSLFLDTVLTVDVISEQERHNLLDAGRDSSMRIKGTVHTLSINGELFADSPRLYFPNAARANEVADLIRRGANICRAKQVPLDLTAGDPSLTDTLLFIDSKVRGGSLIEWRSTQRDSNTGETSKTSTWTSKLIDSEIDADLCQFRFRNRTTVDGGDAESEKSGIRTISFRRLNDIAVSTEQELRNKSYATRGVKLTYATDPTVYRVQGLYFLDQDLADRVAKAMVHAAKLCGGMKKDPF